MSHPTVPEGRTPHPLNGGARINRRRQSSELQGVEDSAISPIFINSDSLIHRAPTTGGGTPWTPAMTATSNNPSARRQRRFFDNGQPKDRKFPSTSSGHPSANTRKSSDNGKDSESQTVIDGINVEKLRNITKETMGTASASSLPPTAVFYASLLYAKTQSHTDCFLYAQALARNGESKRCVRLLEQSGILDPPGNHQSLRLEAVLLAAESLSVLGEWQSVLDLLEDASQLVVGVDVNAHLYTPARYFQIEDDDEMAWDSLFQSVEQPGNNIHPVSRLCLWRGRAYSETGHPQRASIYWQRAIRRDPKCVQAFDLLLSRSVITPQEAYEMIESLTIEPQLEWIRDLYLARIELSPQDIPEKAGFNASYQSTDRDVPIHASMQRLPSETPFASQYLDASSIQLASPSLMVTPRADGIASEPSFHSLLANDVSHNRKTTNGNRTGGYYDKKLPAKSPVQVHVDEAFVKLLNVHKLHQAPEVLSMAARRAYRRYNLRSALEHCQQLAAIDPLCQTAGYVYISTLAALGHKRQLFRLAHDWVEASPKSARAWFAVGSYYYACERYHVAQRHFCRATRLDPHCTEAWIAFGCSFAACDESDQALASFRAAQRLSPGEYASLLYMGMEYLRTNHLVLAQYFLGAAFNASGGDPLCLNELGVLSIQRSDYEAAIDWFSRALRACVQDDMEGDEQRSVAECIELCQDSHWEATIFNLGQCYRKTRKFNEACHCFERCIALSPEKSSGFAALAFTKHLMGHVDKAIDYYHQALSCKPDDPFSSEMLNKALQEALSSSLSLGEDENNIPDHHVTSNAIGNHGSSKSRMGRNLTFQSNANTNTSTSMMSDDGLNLSAESDVDMSLA